MKPNVTIRVACPGSQDVAAESYEGRTINVLATVYENDFKDHESLIEAGLNIPPHIYDAMRGMIQGAVANRIEITEDITAYSCYRHPLGVSRSEQEYKAQNLNKTGVGSQPIQGEVSKVCFQPCEDLEKLRDQSGKGPDHCLDCPIKDLNEDLFLVSLGPVYNPEVIEANINGEKRAVTCGGHCPHARRCLSYNRCLSEFPQKDNEDPIDYDSKS